MNKVLFNFHDVILLLIMTGCIISTCIFWQDKKEYKNFNIFLALFFFATACIPLDILINFGKAFKPFVLENFPDIFFVFEYGAWIQAPLAYWLVRCLLEKDFKFERFDYLLIVPFALAVLHQIMAYHSLPTAMKASIQQALNVPTESVSIFFIQFARDIFRCYMAWLTCCVIRDFIGSMNGRQDKKVPAGYEWLVSFGLGFLVYNAWNVLISGMLIIHVQFNVGMPLESAGLTQNYLTAAFYIGIVILYARSQIQVRNIKPIINKRFQKQQTAYVVNPAYIDTLEPLMKEQKIFTNPDLTLDLLAEKMGISPRTLSGVINGHFGCNFFEYINNYRIQEAKRLLVSDEFCKTSMLNIMYEVGFNSKATFNGFFKKAVGTTPSQYRKQNLVTAKAS